MFSPGDGASTSPPYKEILLREPLYEGARDGSVFIVPDFVTPAKCAALIDAASECIATRPENEEPQARYRLATPSVATGFDKMVLSRLFSLLETQIPELAHSLFGQSTQVCSPLHVHVTSRERGRAAERPTLSHPTPSASVRSRPP